MTYGRFRLRHAGVNTDTGSMHGRIASAIKSLVSLHIAVASISVHLECD